MSAELILGTAGHIDHGKTALVRALTGVDCDRLPEEKARGITIALGFAPLTLPSGRRLGIVDVPGHEKLVRTMVAGATGIDLVLFVVAADEGVMPQTREHLAICNLLGIERGVVALTKIDAAPDDLADVTRLEVEEELVGTSLAGVPCVPVSAHRGDGLDALRDALDRAAAAVGPRELSGAPAWLPVDRVFSKHGFGTVVTGTLRGAPLHENQQVEILAEGGRAPISARVRGLQVHGAASDVVSPGSRCAANLQGIELNQVPRGSVIATPGRVGYRSRIEARVHVLPSAPPLETNKTFTLHVGTSERLARIHLLGARALAPGESGFAEIRLRDPVVALQGDRFILRGFARIPSAGWTIGGGRILDAAPSTLRHPLAKRIAFLEAQAAAFEPGASAATRQSALLARLARAGLRGLSHEALRRDVLSTEGLGGIQIGKAHWMAPEHFDTLVERSTAAVAAHHRAHPEEAMVGLAQVTAQLGPIASDLAVRAALERAVGAGALEAAEGGYCTPGHTAHMADAALGSAVLEELRRAGLAPDNLEALAGRHGVSKAKLRPMVEHLARAGELVRVTSDLFFARPAIDDLRARVVSYLEERGEIDPASYKSLTGQSRKFTVPLMEFFDAERLTVRKGNIRSLRR